MRVANSHPIEILARAGYGARGVVYLLIGALALSAGVTATDQTVSSRRALTSIVGEPLGTTALVLIALGLVGYALWRAAQALLDADHHGTDAKGLAVRGGLLVSAVTHSFLAVFAIQLVWGASTSSGGSGTEDWTAWLMRQTAGLWLVGLVGLTVIGAGIAQAWKGWTEGFRRHMSLPSGWLVPVCRFGLLARGVVFGMIGTLLIVAAWRANPEQAGGLGDALATLHAQPYGEALFVIVALGLLAFGVYSILEGLYRRIEAPEELETSDAMGART